MRMADGGFRPAFNMQFAVDTDTRAIVGVGVTNSGSIAGQITPMIEDVERHTDKTPKEWLVDGGHSSLEGRQAVGEKGMKAYSRWVPEPKSPDDGRHQPKKGDAEHVSAWRSA